MPRPPGSDQLAKRLGARIRRLRERAKITQEKLAWDCDLGKGYLSQVEAGKRLPSLAVLGAFAKRLGVPLREALPEVERRARARGGACEGLLKLCRHLCR